ncbi:P-loop containing nucleoside triphosphate hydrolase protein [Baffinella frigidus]|nr:P-loop containing nucleoside triphosphate hydrolase protein [Cryptophyta sp. CCMP2293]
MVAATRTNASKEDTSVLTFEEVRWTTPDGREVLGGVSGIVVGGTVTAILGASGAGKTTLLQTLGGQHVPTSGTVLFNGAPISSASKRYIGLVPQEDVILPTVTVEEAISFSAAVRDPA